MDDIFKPYLNQKVLVFFRNGITREGVVYYNENHRTYPYKVRYDDKRSDFYTIHGEYVKDHTRPFDIISIQPLMKNFTGIAQKYPHIDLNQFVGKIAFVKFNKAPLTKISSYTIAQIIPDNSGEYSINTFWYTKDGKRSSFYGNNYITEIYDEDAFSVEFKEIPDVDPEVEKAKEAVKKLSEEQIAKLLHSLKK